MSSKGRGRGKGKSEDVSTPWSEWTWSQSHGRFYRARKDSSGEWVYDIAPPASNVPRSASTQTQYSLPYESDTISRYQGGSVVPYQQSNSSGAQSTSGNSVTSYQQSSEVNGSSSSVSYYPASENTYGIPPTQVQGDSGIATSSSTSSIAGPRPSYSIPLSSSASFSPSSSSTMSSQAIPLPLSNSSYNPGGYASMGTAVVNNTPYNPDEHNSIDVLANKFGQASISGSASTSLNSYENQLVDAKNSNSQIEKLDPRYVIVKNGSQFFKVGRIFKVLWAEPAGTVPHNSSSETVHTIQYGEKVYSKIRPFVVIAKRDGHSQCLALSTYSGQGAAKPGLNPNDFAAIYDEKIGRPKFNAGENLTKKSISVVVEDPSEKIDAMTRVNISRIYTVEHNIKVKKVGRVHEKHITRLLQYVDDAWMANRPSRYSADSSAGYS